MKIEKEIQQQKLIETATSYITLYLNQTEIEEVFCKSFDIDLQLFHSFVKLVHKTNNELYEEYNKRQIAEKKEIFKNEMVKIKEGINLIRTGIEENGITREFDMIDFFVYTSLSEHEILNIIPVMDLTANEMRLLKHLLKCQNQEPISETEVFGIENKLLDENGNLRTISKEEKIEILNFLSEHNIPLLGKIYSCALHKYVKNTLHSNKEKTRNI